MLVFIKQLVVDADFIAIRALLTVVSSAITASLIVALVAHVLGDTLVNHNRMSTIACALGLLFPAASAVDALGGALVVLPVFNQRLV